MSSLRMAHAFLEPEIRSAVSLPLAALITGALSQVESTIELTNRVCDSVFSRVKTTESPIARSCSRPA